MTLFVQEGMVEGRWHSLFAGLLLVFGSSFLVVEFYGRLIELFWGLPGFRLPLYSSTGHDQAQDKSPEIAFLHFFN